ncbi:pyruvate kinase [Cystoisospora suis]|uniref:pyruvate kinase n=1 Tax=Cystoisospora suis TaxID=483139 RepID=A0A2C6LBT8_9APIC|nr:pyruvate kinase [Cystoisospora suis]
MSGMSECAAKQHRGFFAEDVSHFLPFWKNKHTLTTSRSRLCRAPCQGSLGLLSKTNTLFWLLVKRAMVPLTVFSCVSFRGGLEAASHVLTPRSVVTGLPPTSSVAAPQSFSGLSLARDTIGEYNGCIRQLLRREAPATDARDQKPHRLQLSSFSSLGRACGINLHHGISRRSALSSRQQEQVTPCAELPSYLTAYEGEITGETRTLETQADVSSIVPGARTFSSTAAFLHPLVGWSDRFGRRLSSRPARGDVHRHMHTSPWSSSRKTKAMARGNRLYHSASDRTEGISPGFDEGGAANSGSLERRRNFTYAKQVATIGPASWDYEEIERLFLTGVDVFRLNMSHGLLSEKHQQLLHVRRVEQVYGHPIAVLADLPGPKFRLGSFENEEAVLEAGQAFTLDSSPVLGDATRVHLPHPEILKALRPQDTLLVDDGKLKLRVVRTITSPAESQGQGETPMSSPSSASSAGVSTQRDKGDNSAGVLSVECEVLVGGVISSKKGINLPASVVPISALSPRDRELARTVAGWGVDWIALSFVQSAEDVHALRQELRDAAVASSSSSFSSQGVHQIRRDINVIVKIEKPVALKNFESILSAADGVMVARGDLGVELQDKMAYLPSIQKRLVDLCREAGKPVVVATQMLESMIHSPIPTRAEVSDVANAVYDGADAVMLSGETAAGDFPSLVAQTQRQGIQAVETDLRFWNSLSRQREAFRQKEERDVQGTIQSDPNKGTHSEAEISPSRPGASVVGVRSNTNEAIMTDLLKSFLSHNGNTSQPQSLADGEASPSVGMRNRSVEGKSNGSFESHQQRGSTNSAWLSLGAEGLARFQKSKAIVVFSENGDVARRLAALRPVCPVIAATRDPLAARQLQLYWGVYPVLLGTEEFSQAVRSVNAHLQSACEIAQKEGFISSPTDDIVVAGVAPGNEKAGEARGPERSAPFLTVCNSSQA